MKILYEVKLFGGHGMQVQKKLRIVASSLQEVLDKVEKADEIFDPHEVNILEFIDIE
jgi:hypothetical protein